MNIISVVGIIAIALFVVSIGSVVAIAWFPIEGEDEE